MAELIYSVKNLFSTDPEGCLLDYEAKFFHIASYQRGYKWGSDPNGAVTILLNDLWDAYFKSKDTNTHDYFLQYITLKKLDLSNYLEVIDGQQRLTTLSVLLSVISLRLRIDNIACDKLEYAVRSNFFEEFVYTKDCLEQLLVSKWDRKTGLTINGKNFNNQDTYYIFNALQKCDSFFNDVENDDLMLFYHFLLNHVLIIVNVVEHVISEKIFSNLNSNKVPLTESELVKALFITKFARVHNNRQKNTFREIQEKRLILGRRWDEIENWANDHFVQSYYFSAFHDPMFGFLSLVANSIEKKDFIERTAHNELFNFFNNQDIIKIQEELYNTFWILKDWMKEPIIYNRLGFLFFFKGSAYTILDFVDDLKYDFKASFQKDLLEKVMKEIPSGLDINYENHKEEIHKVLLALNVFHSIGKFDFYSYVKEKWTLEHIFPQTPEGRKNVLTIKDKEYILDMVKPEDKKNVEDVLNKPERNLDEKEVYTDALKRSGYIHHLGNMCLLSNVDNILNGCGFYDEKRTKILNRVKNGRFIPSHTIEVFTKSIFEKDPGDFTRWTKSNIDMHKVVIDNRMSILTDMLQKELKNESRKI